jgi:adenosylcobinamide-phosphate synthase/adenosylcobinamide-GDP ribazoletransferase
MLPLLIVIDSIVAGGFVMRGIRRLAQRLIMPGRAFIAALQFLTRLPIPVQVADDPGVFRRSTVFYPAAGLVIGGMVAGIGYGASFVFPAPVNAALLLCIWVLLTGGLHLDGLMDTADGLLSHRSRERMLEIMKDSRVGAMGVIACVLYLLLKWSLLISLLTPVEAHADSIALWLLALLPVWSRTFLPAAIVWWPYARQGGGLGQWFRSVRKRHALGAIVLAFAITMVGLHGSGLFAPRATMLWSFSMAAAVFMVGGICSLLVSRKLGGLTGDVYGALNELLELVLLLVVAGFLAS